MKLYFETKKYPHKNGTSSIAIDTENKCYTIEDYFKLSCRIPCDNAIIITVTEYQKLEQKLIDEGWQLVREWK